MLEWTKEELKSIDFKTREFMTMNGSLHPSEEWMLKFVAGEKGLSEVEDADASKKCLKGEKKSQWLEKPFHGRFLKDKKKVSTEIMWQWLKEGLLKKEAEAMVCAAQEPAL